MTAMGNKRKTLAIIGGGAAGLAAAVAAARELRAIGAGEGAAIEVVEADERVGRSILATGNGRCNFSNACIDAGAYRNAEFVGEALRALADAAAGGPGAGKQPPQVTDPVLAFFADLGLAWREEGEGRLYPLANKASVVLDVLRSAARDLGVAEVCGCAVEEIVVPERPGGRFHLRCAGGVVRHADAVIVAVGGAPAEGLLPPAFPRVPAQAVLGPLRTDTAVVRQLDNIRVRCAVSLVRPGGGGGKPIAREEGELLFRSYGVSGIAVFNLSRFAEPGDELAVDFLPQVDVPGAEGLVRARRKRLAAQGRAFSGEDVLRGLLLPPVARAVLKRAGLVPEAPLAKGDAPALARALKAFSLTVEGVGDARQCQVARGGLDVGAFDPATMEAHGLPGLFAVGEALDVDAPCGGYNLHWAWATGILAARTAAARLAEGAAHA